MTAIVASRTLAQTVLAAAAEAGVRPPTSVIAANITDTTVTVTWTPDLTAQEAATLQTLRQLAIGSTLITPAELATIQPDIDGLVTFQGIASPTLAQTASAVKAQSRILRAILRS